MCGLMRLRKSRPRVFDEGLDSLRILFAWLAFDSADDVDSPGLQDLNCFLHVFWRQAAGSNQPQLWRGPLQRVSRVMPIEASAGTPHRSGRRGVHQDRILVLAQFL